MTHESDRQLPIACDLGAIDPDRRPVHLARIERLLRELPVAVEALPDGLAFRFDPEHYITIAEVVAEERLCCPFFRFVLDVAPERGPVWLRITGPDDARAILGALTGLPGTAELTDPGP
jgi:hypothetical protein